MSRAVRAVRLEVIEEGHSARLTHDLPCLFCGHGPHRFLPCDHDCGCPGEQR